MSPAGANQGLLRSPTNLKEAIDWILRVTNKDDCLCPLSQAVVTVLRDVQVKEYIGSRNRNSTVNRDLDSSDEEWNLVQNILASIETIGGVRTTRKLIEEVAEGLRKFVGYTEDENGQKTIKMGDKGIGCPGKNGGSSGNGCSHGDECDGYKSSYDKDSATFEKLNSDRTGNDWTTLAKIFLGAIPFVFSGLSYMYWYSSRKDISNDRVKSETQLLGQYMRRMGYDPSVIRDGINTDVGHTNASGSGPNGNNTEGFAGKHLYEIIKDSGILVDTEEAVDEDISKWSFAMYLEKVREKVREEVTKKGDPGRNEFEGILDTSVPTEETEETIASHALLKLNILCTGYFRALNQPYRVHRRNHRLPRTIREILYWLSCVQYCPVFRVLVQKMQQLCQRVGGDTGITFYSEKKTCLITPDNSVSYFLSAALVAPMVLLSIQDTIESLVPEVGGQVTDTSATKQKATNEMTYEEKIDRLADNSKPVPIHDLYANTLFEFRFPMSETQSYYLLQDCLVALYYQLYFLKQQCNWIRQDTSGDGFGWAFCRYGDGVNSDKCNSWICPQAKAASSTGGDENTNYAGVLRNHTGQCGNSSASPLQAFLCDCLPGITCGEVMEKQGLLSQMATEKDMKNYNMCYPPFLEHRTHAGYGQYCPIPMGFSGSFKGAPAPGVGGAASNGIGMSGLGLNAICAHYANDDLTDSCLYQITRCICSLTRRVPRSVGTIYGFFQGILGVYQSGSSTTGGGATAVDDFKKALDVELAKETFGLQKSVTLMTVVKEWKTKKGDHSTSGDCCSLDSLSGCEGSTEKNQTCGKYLHPISGSLYNSVATVYTDTYLSWILYLTGVLKSGLESLRDAFLQIDCSTSGCVKTNDGVIQPGNQKCDCHSKGCIKGNHGNGNKPCCCWSVVHCAGVYGVFYRFGFSIHSPFGLSGRETGSSSYTGDSKRTCHDFYKQLQTVITGDLFSDLLAQIRRFLYTNRLPFGLMIFSFWSAVLVYLLWSITGPLDVLHIQSHWNSPGSYLVSLQRLLADGSRKGFCTLGYFQEGTGDRLLSQGVSDLYL